MSVIVFEIKIDVNSNRNCRETIKIDVKIAELFISVDQILRTSNYCRKYWQTCQMICIFKCSMSQEKLDMVLKG